MSQLLSLKNPVGEVVMATGIVFLIQLKAPLSSVHASATHADKEQRPREYIQHVGGGGGLQPHLLFLHFLIWVL